MYRIRESLQSRGRRISSVAAVIVITMLLFLYNWNCEAVATTHTQPGVEKRNIYTWVKQRKLAEPQLHMLADQTGVNEQVVEAMLENGQWQLLLELQGAYFAPVSIESISSSPVTISEYLVDQEGNYVDGPRLVDIQDGDILITKNSRFLGWRNGHAGLVVDAEEGLVLEAIMLGVDTKLCSLDKWEGYPAFQVLRLKEEIDASWRGQAAANYASEHLVDIPYQLLAGVRDRLFAISGAMGHREQGDAALVGLKGTQCAHLVWYAYKQVGIDLDSDGGLFVTPADIQGSPYLEVVQSYGY